MTLTEQWIWWQLTIILMPPSCVGSGETNNFDEAIRFEQTPLYTTKSLKCFNDNHSWKLWADVNLLSHVCAQCFVPHMILSIHLFCSQKCQFLLKRVIFMILFTKQLYRVSRSGFTVLKHNVLKTGIRYTLYRVCYG